MCPRADWLTFYGCTRGLLYGLIVVRQLLAVGCAPGWIILRCCGVRHLAVWLMRASVDEPRGFRAVLGPDAAIRMTEGAILVSRGGGLCAVLSWGLLCAVGASAPSAWRDLFVAVIVTSLPRSRRVARGGTRTGRVKSLVVVSHSVSPLPRAFDDSLDARARLIAPNAAVDDSHFGRRRHVAVCTSPHSDRHSRLRCGPPWTRKLPSKHRLLGGALRGSGRTRIERCRILFARLVRFGFLRKKAQSERCRARPVGTLSVRHHHRL